MAELNVLSTNMVIRSPRSKSLLYLLFENENQSSMQIEKASNLKFSTKKKFKNLKVLAFSIYILKKSKDFFKMLACQKENFF